MATPTRRDTLNRFFRRLDTLLTIPATVIVGGASSLILGELLERQTEDVDVVDAIPEAIRKQPEALERLTTEFGLMLTHFQSHYLPHGWASRTLLYERYRNLTVRLVDPVDLTLGKLFSTREKDRQDLHVLAGHFEKAVLQARLADAYRVYKDEPRQVEAAKQNWYVLFGEDLPTIS